MRVLCVTHYFASHGGGIEIVAGHIARGLAARGIEVTWAATALADELPERTAGLQPLPLSGSNLMERVSGLPFPVWRPGGLRTLREAIGGADVIHCHDGIYDGSRAALRIGRSIGRPVILTQHIAEIPFSRLIPRVAMKAANFLWTRPAVRNCDWVVFISESVREFFRSDTSPGRSSTIYNGVDGLLFHPPTHARSVLRSRLGIDPSVPVFLFVGRFVEKKGLSLLREATKATPQAQWILIGRGPIDPKSWGISNVRVEGPFRQADLAAWYGAADLLVLPSIGEGFPLVVQESMACGTPCLVSEEIRQACPESGPLLLSAGPRGRNLVSAVHAALGARAWEDLSGRVAAYAREAWSWDRCVAAYLKLYQNLVGGRGVGRLGSG